MVFNIRSAIAVSFLLSLPLMAAPKSKLTTWTIDPDHSAVNFKIKHLSIANVNGSFHGLSGTVKTDENNILKTSVDVKIDLNMVNTGIEKRDKHLRSDDYFGVTKFPTATFVSNKVTRVEGRLKMTGKLTLHGQTKEVVLDVSEPSEPIKGPDGKRRVGMSATTTLNRRDFNVAMATAAAMVGDEVKIEIELELTSPMS